LWNISPTAFSVNALWGIKLCLFDNNVRGYSCILIILRNSAAILENFTTTHVAATHNSRHGTSEYGAIFSY
jgi:hypothetical protein